jgi:hypothetical protein
MEAQTRRAGTTVVNHLLVRGCHDTVTCLVYCFLIDDGGYVTNHSKENGVGHGDAPYGEIL